jgi:polyhydroxybutyrate depolymerase
VPPSNRTDAETIRADVAVSYCIDEARVYYTGHSDGGSMATLLPFWHGAPVAAVAPSAAGIDVDSGSTLGCTGAVPAMVIHSRDDAIFTVPDHGIGAANHWASCLSCQGQGAPLADGCVPFTGCVEGAEVLYCETTGDHYEWYGYNQSMLDFFDRHARELSL